MTARLDSFGKTVMPIKTGRNLLLVDVSNQAYVAAASHPMLTTLDGETFTGGLYGFMCAVAKAINKTQATAICLCEDRKPYHRSIVYPEYKSLRNNTKDPVLVEKVKTTVEQIRNLCVVTGWPIWSVPSFESDDLVAHTVIQYRNRYETITAMSNDSDLYQLFEWPQFQIFKGKKGLFLHEDYLEEWRGLPANKLIQALALTGTHNEVAGIKGIGPVTAIHALNNIGHMLTLLSLHKELFERNLSLIQLPHKDFPVSARMPLKGEYDERKLMRFCAQYGIKLERWMCESYERVK